MNAGFSSLTALKAQILAQSLRARTDFDAQLLALGLGVASAIEGTLGRKLTRTEGDTLIVPGDEAVYSLPRYPVETVTALEYRTRSSDAWADGIGQLYTTNSASGLAYLTSPLTDRYGQVRFTYTAGYWWDTSENASGTLPEGAAALPGAILSAWHIQIEALWRAKDKLGTQIAKEPEAAAGLTSPELLPAVVAMLAPFRRLSL